MLAGDVAAQGVRQPHYRFVGESRMPVHGFMTASVLLDGHRPARGEFAEGSFTTPRPLRPGQLPLAASRHPAYADLHIHRLLDDYRTTGARGAGLRNDPQQHSWVRCSAALQRPRATAFQSTT